MDDGFRGGIGLAAAEAFATAGAAVVLADIDEATAIEQAERLTAAGHRALGVRCDVADEDSVAVVVARTVEAFGRLDAAYNNAGIHVAVAETADVEAADFDRIMAINVRGVFNCMKHELRQMRVQGSGAIVNCSSQSGTVGLPGLSAYTASKHAVIGLTRAAALEYANARRAGWTRSSPTSRWAGWARPMKSPLPCSGCADPAPVS